MGTAGLPRITLGNATPCGRVLAALKVQLLLFQLSSSNSYILAFTRVTVWLGTWVTTFPRRLLIRSCLVLEIGLYFSQSSSTDQWPPFISVPWLEGKDSLPTYHLPLIWYSVLRWSWSEITPILSAPAGGVDNLVVLFKPAIQWFSKYLSCPMLSQELCSILGIQCT